MLVGCSSITVYLYRDHYHKTSYFNPQGRFITNHQMKNDSQEEFRDLMTIGVDSLVPSLFSLARGVKRGWARDYGVDTV